MRHLPIEHAFDHPHYQWLIDVDAPPALPRWLEPWTQIRAEDHLAGKPGLPALKDAVRDLLGRTGIETSAADRVVMLAHARVLGHVFDPMSAYWCFDPTGDLRGVVIEVHNTYGGRHAYVVPAAEVARAEVGKEFYVSPFNDVAGEYQIRIQLDRKALAIAIRLRRDGQRVLSAAVQGECRPATSTAVTRIALRHPFMPQRVSALIRAHGIWLWARRLPVHPRPGHPREGIR